MTPTTARSRAVSLFRRGLPAICCAVLFMSGVGLVLAQEKPETPAPSPAPAAAAGTDAATIPPEQLESLVAPIALYPDPLLAQTLVAATYPLEIVQLQQWLAKNKDLKDKALADAVAKQPWDPSIQSMAAVPDVVKRLADDIQWTTDLGNAFLAQQGDVMDAVQRMRKKAVDKGALESNEQQKVETKVVEEKTVIVVESANPEVMYVPSYSPVVVYGAPLYPYPPIYYPPYPPGGAFISFSFGVMMGAAFWGGSCCGCGWGGNDIDINVNNNFNQINHNGNRGGAGAGGGSGNWQHNPQHRGGTPYADKSTANKYGGSARGDAQGGRQPSAGQQPARQPGSSGSRAGSAGVSDRSAGGAAGAGSAGASNRAAGGAGGGAGGGSYGGGGDKIGGRDIPKSSAKGAGGFSGGSGGYSGSSARASSSRGASSMGSRGGAPRGGGGSRRR